MLNLKFLPLRQKILIGLTIIGGLFLYACSAFSLIEQDTINELIFLYSIGVPLFLLMLDTVIDLNDNKVFAIWLGIAIVIFAISLTTYGNDKFIIQRSSSFNPDSGINGLMSEYSTSSLKALLLFLIAYWPLNKLLNKNGFFLVNTFHQINWEHPEAQRRITAPDIVINVILYAVIIIASLFGP